MTIAGAFWRRRFPRLSAAESREFETEPGTRVLVKCHWQTEPRAHSTIVLLHGLEGSCDSGYMAGIAEQAFGEGFNVLRANQRNCGGTDGLTPTLYNSGLSVDIRAIVTQLIERDALSEIFVAGFSMGGNLVLKMAGEFAGNYPSELKAVIGICPSCDLGACADALGKRENVFYQRHFVRRLTNHMAVKAGLFPERYPLNGIEKVRTVREFDDVITARFCGFRDADDYYYRSSALRVAASIRVPTIIIAAQDDPIIPFRTFSDASVAANPNIQIIAPKYGGHCAFVSRESGAERFWAEARVVEIFKSRAKLLNR
jgi:uncharacterized protein